MNKKAIVIFDTNKLLQNPEDKRYYSEIDLGGDFYKLYHEFLPENYLKDNVVIAIPKICIEEIKQRKIEDFESKFQSLKAKYEDFKKIMGLISDLVECDIKEPKKKSNYIEQLQNKVEEFVSKNNVIILNFPNDAHFKEIIKRAVNRKTPFQKTRNDGSDKGFKDVIVWHSILDYKDILNYDYHILYTQDGGYDLNCLDEFEELFGKKIKRIEDFEELKEELLKIYPEEVRDKIKIRSRVEDSYFKEQLREKLNEMEDQLQHIHTITLKEVFVDGSYQINENDEEKIHLISKISISYEKEGSVTEDLDIEIILNDIFEIENIDDSTIFQIEDELEAKSHGKEN